MDILSGAILFTTGIGTDLQSTISRSDKVPLYSTLYNSYRFLTILLSVAHWLVVLDLPVCSYMKKKTVVAAIVVLCLFDVHTYLVVQASICQTSSGSSVTGVYETETRITKKSAH